jgi:DNA polymerase V
MREDVQPSGVSVHAGFPNPAADTSLGGLDLNRLLIRSSASTFLFRLSGNDWENFGIFDGDIAVVDRAVDARKGDLVIWWDEHVDEFAISKYKDLPAGATVWGVVTSTVHQFRKDAK